MEKDGPGRARNGMNFHSSGSLYGDPLTTLGFLSSSSSGSAGMA